jgi:hypothetical protein
MNADIKDFMDKYNKGENKSKTSKSPKAQVKKQQEQVAQPVVESVQQPVTKFTAPSSESFP